MGADGGAGVSGGTGEPGGADDVGAGGVDGFGADTLPSGEDLPPGAGPTSWVVSSGDSSALPVGRVSGAPHAALPKRVTTASKGAAMRDVRANRTACLNETEDMMETLSR